ncbi:hypothetical protein EMIT0P395_140056 [Pseudomonas sp. IT-P395]
MHFLTFDSHLNFAYNVRKQLDKRIV